MKKQYYTTSRLNIESLKDTRFGGEAGISVGGELRKVSPVTYKLAVPSRRSKTVVRHVNRLKQWHTPVYVADDQPVEYPL
jgi:hypothetical protein